MREKYRDEVARGFDISRLSMRAGCARPIEPARFEGFEVIASLREVAERRFDQVRDARVGRRANAVDA